MTTRFVTVHLLVPLPLHNLNRDQNGLPKSQFDGAVQRARLSSQSLKRGAREHYRTLGHDESIRTRQAKAEVLTLAAAYAERTGLSLDEAAAKKSINAVVGGLTRSDQKTETKQQADLEAAQRRARTAAEKQAKKEGLSDEGTAQLMDAAAEQVVLEQKLAENIIFLSRNEMATLAHAVVDKQQEGTEAGAHDLIADATSPSLEIAAFGRMFANAADKGTHAAVAVSHATTTHPMRLVADYFSAVEDLQQNHSGAAHIGQSYFTSGVYYRTFTIDVDQLERSWSTMHEEGGREALSDLVRSLLLALPSGKLNATNAGAHPALVLVEEQDFRVAYDFETPVAAGEPDGGYLRGSVERLADQRAMAMAFDPANFGDAVIQGQTFGRDFIARPVEGIDGIIEFVVSHTFKDDPS